MSNRKKHHSWIATVFFITFILSFAFTIISNEIIVKFNIIIAILGLLCMILLNVLSDIIGIAATSSDETPFHSRASRKHKGAKEAIFLVKNAHKVSVVCSDIIGDVCGVASGGLSALISLRLVEQYDYSIVFTGIIVGSLAASLTVLGKAIGKIYAIKHNTELIYFIGGLLHYTMGNYIVKNRHLNQKEMVKENIREKI